MKHDIPEVQQAVRDLPGVANASVKWPDPQGPAYLRLEFAHGADERTVTERVLETLQRVGGVDLSTLETKPEPHRPPAAEPLDRPVFQGMTIERADLDTSVEVTLRWRGREAVGRADGLASHQTTPRTAAAAALAALREFLSPGVRVHLDWLEVVEGSADRPGIVQAAVTVLTLGDEHVYVGSAFVRGDLREAAVRATLDALNRRIARLPANAV